MINREHLERLIGSHDRDAMLVVIRGEVAVIPEASLESGEYAGALIVTSRNALIAEFDVGASDEQMDQLAERLAVALSDLSG